MDVYLKDEDKVINVEMQASNHGDLPRRARYYQAAADIDTTPKGSEYSDLKQNYVIFICTFDPFQCGKAMYHFANYCINHDFPIPLEDGTAKLFLNTACTDTTTLDGELGLFYDYVRERTAQTPFTRELDKTISRMKQEQEERNMYLTYTSRMMECRRDGYEEGISIGLERGLEQGLERGLEQGLERGAYQNKLEMARKLIARGNAAEDIADLTGLDLSQVEELMRG